MPRSKELYGEACEAIYPGQSLIMDVLGPFPEEESSQRYVICVIDHMSRWAEAHVKSKISTKEVVKVLNQWVKE